MSSTRIYHLSDAGQRHLVRAVSSAQAVSFVARSRFPCRVATQDDLAQLLTAGARVHDASDPKAPPLDAPPAEPVLVVAPVASVAMSGVESVGQVLSILSPGATHNDPAPLSITGKPEPERMNEGEFA